MEHNKDKIFHVFLIKNVLEHYKIIDDNLLKSEKPDFKNNNTGLEITRADPTLEFDGFISKFTKDNTINIKKFNKIYEKKGGKVLKKTDPIVKLLNLQDCFKYHEDYVYVSPCYTDNFDFVNEKVKDKLNKLNNLYDKEILNYYLVIFSPIYVNEYMIKEEFYQLKKIESVFNKKFDKIIVIFIDKLCEFDLINLHNILYTKIVYFYT